MFVCVYHFKYSRVFKVFKVKYTSKLTTILFLSIVFVGACSVRKKENCYCGHGKSRNNGKDAFEIANESDIVLQSYDEEWIIIYSELNIYTWRSPKHEQRKWKNMFVTFTVKNKSFSQFNMNSSFSNFFWYPGVGEFGHFFLPHTQGIKYALFGVFWQIPGGRTPGEAADTFITHHAKLHELKICPTDKQNFYLSARDGRSLDSDVRWNETKHCWTKW